MTRSFCLLLVLLLSAGVASAADTVAFLYRQQQGDTSVYDVTNRTVIRSPAMPQSMSSTVRSVFDVVTTSTTEEQIGLDFAYRKVEMTTGGAASMGRSDTTVTLPADTSLKLSVIIDRKGNILLAWPSAALAVAYQTGSRIGGNGMQSAVRNIFPAYPPGAVAPEDTWTTRTVDTSFMAGGLVITQSLNMMTFDGVTDTLGVRCARIAVRSDSVTLTGDSKPVGDGVSVSGRGALSGVYYVSLESGALLAQTMHTDMEIFMTPAGQEKAAVTMHLSSDVLVERRRNGK